MQKNLLEVLGNLAVDATVATVSATREVLNLRVITSQTWTDSNGETKSALVGHEVVKFGKTGQFTNFLPYLKKGQGVSVSGLYEKELTQPNADGKRFLNNRINASFGTIDPITSTGTSINEHKIAGFLTADAVIRPTSKGDSLSFTIAATNSWGNGANQSKTYYHDIVQFGDKGAFDKLSALLVKGTGAYTKGMVEKVNNENAEGEKFLNITTNATFNNVTITKYKTEKPAQEPAKEPAQKAPVNTPDPAPAQSATVNNEPTMDFDDDIPF